MKIALDCLGGDNAPVEIIQGAILALQNNKDLELVLFGDPKRIESEFTKTGMVPEKVEIIASKEAVTNSDQPATFLREKPNCSLAMMFSQAKRRDDIAACVSAGPTGAILTGAILELGRLKGVKRPALMAALPTTTKSKTVQLLDAGANMDCKDEYLLQFALMADSFLKTKGMKSPRVGLLNVGEEEGKGNEVAKSAYDLLRSAPINFVGNIEPDKVLLDKADIVVCDGFWGNVFIKSGEGATAYTSGLIKEAFYSSFLSKIGGLLVKRSIEKAKAPLSAITKASAPLLGINKLVLKCHGRADRESIRLTLLEADKLVRENLTEKIAKSVESLQIAAK